MTAQRRGSRRRSKIGQKPNTNWYKAMVIGSRWLNLCLVNRVMLAARNEAASTARPGRMMSQPQDTEGQSSQWTAQCHPQEGWNVL